MPVCHVFFNLPSDHAGHSLLTFAEPFLGAKSPATTCSGSLNYNENTFAGSVDPVVLETTSLGTNDHHETIILPRWINGNINAFEASIAQDLYAPTQTVLTSLLRAEEHLVAVIEYATATSPLGGNIPLSLWRLAQTQP